MPVGTEEMPAEVEAPASTAPTTEGNGSAAAPVVEVSQDNGAAAAQPAQPAAQAESTSAPVVQPTTQPLRDPPKDLDKLYSCKWKNGNAVAARVIERRLGKDGKWEYYMHYEEYDRRLDEWVEADRLGDEIVKHKAKDSPMPVTDSGQKMTRTQKRKFDEINTTTSADVDPTTAALEHEREQATKVKNIQVVELGCYEMDTWYYSPYPEEFSKCTKLYLCEYCLKYFRKAKTLDRHKTKCEWRHPPGDEIYRDGQISMFEVDGKKAKIYCQSLCLLSKLFLDHKTLYYDVEPFHFYVMTEVDNNGCHVVGYFSKEKDSPDDHNLACIMVLPPHQRKRYGRFLISFSYELSKKEGRVGTPERPLSDLGLLGYRSYWKSVLLDVLCKHKGNLSIKDISLMTAIKPDDIITTLQSMGLIKYWKGQHLISVSPKVIEEHLSRQSKTSVQFEDSKLIWTPHQAQPNTKKPFMSKYK